MCLSFFFHAMVSARKKKLDGEEKMRQGRAFLLLTGYNRQEAARLFRAMLDEDGSNAFAHWGVAYKVYLEKKSLRGSNT